MYSFGLGICIVEFHFYLTDAKVPVVKNPLEYYVLNKLLYYQQTTQMSKQFFESCCCCFRLFKQNNQFPSWSKYNKFSPFIIIMLLCYFVYTTFPYISAFVSFYETYVQEELQSLLISDSLTVKLLFLTFLASYRSCDPVDDRIR